MPTLIKRSYPAEQKIALTNYEFELNAEETKKFLSEFLSDFWYPDKVPVDQEVVTQVTFKMDFFKKEMSDEEEANQPNLIC